MYMTWKALVCQQSSRSGSRGYVAETQKFEVVEASFDDCFEKGGKISPDICHLHKGRAVDKGTALVRPQTVGRGLQRWGSQ